MISPQLFSSRVFRNAPKIRFPKEWSVPVRLIVYGWGKDNTTRVTASHDGLELPPGAHVIALVIKYEKDDLEGSTFLQHRIDEHVNALSGVENIDEIVLKGEMSETWK